MPKNKNLMAAIVSPPSQETTAPETDNEHNQRYMSDMDHAIWQGNHPPPKGPRAVVHRMATAERAPHIYKDAK